jgi:hypothetical protein
LEGKERKMRGTFALLQREMMKEERQLSSHEEWLKDEVRN